MELTPESNINQAFIHHKINDLNVFLNLDNDEIDKLKRPASPEDLNLTDLIAEEKREVRASLCF